MQVKIYCRICLIPQLLTNVLQSSRSQTSKLLLPLTSFGVRQLAIVQSLEILFSRYSPKTGGYLRRKKNNHSNLDKKLTEKTKSPLKETISNILLAMVSGLNSIYSNYSNFPMVSGP